MKYDMVITDFDGTLSSGEGKIDAETLKSIKEYIDRGGKFVICSGRMTSSVKYVSELNGLKSVAVSNQGASIDDLETGENLFSGGIPVPLAIDIAERFLSDGMEVLAVIDEKFYYEQSTEWTLACASWVDSVGIFTASITDTIRNIGKPVKKLCAYAPRPIIKKYTEIYNRDFSGVTFNNGSPDIVEAIMPECSKGAAVRFLSKKFNIPFNKILTCGDSTNDIELVKGEWHGVAVGDGMEDLKRVAKEVTVPFSEHPVKVLLEKYCLKDAN